MNIRHILAPTLLALSAGANASNADPQDLMFARAPDNSIVILPDARLGCKGIKQAYYVLGPGGKATGSGCYFAYGEAVLGQDVEGKPQRWPLASFKQTEYAAKNRIGIPTARD